ncbi:GNAT family N-acetyltransferase [Inquilinus limosus]|uniref:GNAT family N-acetyltransferase n=1 Tax=Inquilinus limosus TaxID=171674 RepID=UPI00041110F7|nr:GNAT family N-acetyltransferase [Inquilinus limosus]
MAEVTVRPAKPGDRAALLAALVDMQEYERALHDTRRPGSETAQPYLDWLEGHAAERGGVILVAVSADGDLAGFSAGWVQQDDLISETSDSNRFGYVSDVYTAPAWRGRGVAGRLLAAIEAHLRGAGVVRMRIGVLANNDSAIRAYRKHGFDPYEMILEKRL